MLLLNQVELARFAAGPLAVLRTAGPVPIIAAIALAVVGIIVQMRLAVNTEVRLWRDATGESS